VRWAEEIGGRDRQLAEWAEDLGKRDRELAECAQDLGKRDRELAELAGALRTRAEARRPGAYGLGRRGALPEVPVDPAAGWRQPVVAQSILLWTFPHGSRRRAACEALLGTLAAMRRAR
jgi:hypothetical protein